MSIRNIVVSILAVIAFSSFATAQDGQRNQLPREGGFGRGDGRSFGRGFGMMRNRMPGPGRMDFGRLNLTDAQKQRIQTLQENSRKSWETNKAQFEEIGRLMQLKRAGLLTTEQGTRLTSLQAQMKTNMEKTHNDILAVLTPEQRTLADQMKNERQGRIRGMRDGMMRRRGQDRPNRPDVPRGERTPPKPPTQ